MNRPPGTPWWSKGYALFNRDALNWSAARPLPELTRRQKLLSNFLGGWAIERATREQLDEGIERNVKEIKEVFDEHPLSGKQTTLKSSSIWLSQQSSMRAGLPYTIIEFQKITPKLGPVVTFHSPPEAKRPNQQTRMFLLSPSFRITEAGIETKLISGSQFSFKPCNQLTFEQQRLAYLITSDVAESMHQADQDGLLNIQ